MATLVTASALTGVFAAPAGAEEPTSTAPSTSEEAPSGPVQPQDDPVPQPDLDVSFVFKPSYPATEDVHFSIKITNTRSVPAEDLHVAHFFTNPDDLVVSFVDGWGQLSQQAGVTLQPGETFEQPVVGQIQDISLDYAMLRGFVYDKDGHGVAPSFNEKITLEKSAGHASGVVYGDRNGNGKLDRGEELKGTTLTLQHGKLTYRATSDEHGALDFGEIPAGEYTLPDAVLDGWLFPLRTVQVGPDTKLVVRGTPPLNGALTASMAFTQDAYQVGELAHVTVKLANSGPIPLTGIVAQCNRIGDDYILKGYGPGWGDLVWSRGVTIAPGETRTFDVTEAVPAAAFDRGAVFASCDFGYYEVDVNNHVQADDRASVPGAKAVVEGNIGVFDNQNQVQEGAAGVKVVLVSDQHCPVTGEATTDAKGHFEFRDVVPGPDYRLYFLPTAGWKIKDANPMWIAVYGPPENHRVWRVDAEKGDAPLPTVPVNPADCGAATPATGATTGSGGGESSGGGLASTGVDALGLGALALVALVLGGGLVIGGRRRRRSA